ncbi:MAG: amino acid permease [Gammaproteobacteria bacterium]
MFTQLFRTKHVSEGGIGGSGLKRCLTAFDLTLLGIGAIIGAGIFVITGKAAANQAGPAVILSFVVAGSACAFAALAYAELAASVGGCGSAYGYSYAAFGELFAWVIGWALLLEYGLAVSAVANGWSGYFNNALTAMEMGLPDHLLNGPMAGGIINLPAFCIVGVLMVLLIAGVKQSARFNAAMVFVKLLTIAVFIGIAVFNVNPDHWSPFMPYGWIGEDAGGHPTGVLAGAAKVFFAYIGFDAVSTAAEEAHDPQRDLPTGIIASLAICTVIYIVVAGLLTAVVPYTDLNVAHPVAHALELIGFQGASALVAAGAIAGLTTVMLVLYYGLTRIIFAMGRDGLIPATVAAVNAKTQTPVVAIVVCGVVMSLLAGFVSLDELAELVNMGTLSAFVMVCLGVLLLRRLRPELHRPFKTPFGALFPVLGMLSCGALMLALPAKTFWLFLAWLGLGLMIYFGYSFRHSKLAAEASA